ncbi:MAG: hypothetical protein RR766_00720 [Longicatena sp.]
MGYIILGISSVAVCAVTGFISYKMGYKKGFNETLTEEDKAYVHGIANLLNYDGSKGDK